MILTVEVKPNAKETKIISWRDRATIIMAVKEPPTDGKANAALIKFLSKSLKIPQKDIVIKRGAGSKIKHIQLPDGTNISALQ